MLQRWTPSQRTAKALTIFSKSAMRCEGITSCCYSTHSEVQLDHEGFMNPTYVLFAGLLGSLAAACGPRRSHAHASAAR